MELRLRDAGPGDLELLLTIREASFREIVEEVREWDSGRERESMERRLREDWVSVLELEGKPCGYVSWALDEDDGGLWLHNLFVLPEYQSRGIGGWALGRMVAVARESGEVLQLRCLKHNERALAFYDRDGLRRTGESETHVYFEG